MFRLSGKSPVRIFRPHRICKQSDYSLPTSVELFCYAQTECLFYLGYIYLDERNEPAKSLRVRKKLVSLYPGNTWFQADLAHSLIMNGQFEEADRIFDQLIAAFSNSSGATRQLTSPVLCAHRASRRVGLGPQAVHRVSGRGRSSLGRA